MVYKLKKKKEKSRVKAGAPGEIRTPDFLFRRQALYPTELRAQHGTLYQKGNRVTIIENKYNY